MEVKDIGRLTGKVLVFGGVYSNLQALEKIKSIADDMELSTNNIICTGDIIGYCAQPEESLRFVKEWGIHCIAGNVELQIRSGEEDCGCNFDEGTRCDAFSRNWYPYAYKHTSDEMTTWLKTMPEFISFKYAGLKGFVLHGGLEDTSQFIFKSTPWQLKKEILNKTKSDFILSGHCGLPFNHTENNKYWLNAGVIGMPANDGTPRVWYMILDDNNGFQFSHQSFIYNHEKAAELMKSHQLPLSYANTLSSGIWDNMEILNDAEASLQGLPI